MQRTNECLYCHGKLSNPKAKYCSDAHKKAWVRQLQRGIKSGQVVTNNRDKLPEQKPVQVIEVNTDHEHGAGIWYIANCPLCFEDIQIEISKRGPIINRVSF